MAKSKKKRSKKPRTRYIEGVGSLYNLDNPENISIIPMSGSASLIRINNKDAMGDANFLRKLSRDWNLSSGDLLRERENENSKALQIISEHLSKVGDGAEDIRVVLLKEYNKALIGIYGKSKSDILSNDIIDVRKMGNLMRSNKELYSKEAFDAYMAKSDFFYDKIPCFTHGVYQYEDDCYIEWRINEINEDQKYIKVYLMHYFDSSEGFWEPGVSCTVKASLYVDSDGEETLSLDVEDSGMKYSDIYSIIPYSSFPWTDQQKSFWTSVIKRHAYNIDGIAEKKNTSSVTELAKEFFLGISCFNFILSITKPSKPRNSGKSCNTKHIVKYSNNPNIAQGRKIRYVGILPVTSKEPPKSVTPENLRKVSDKDVVIHYRVASWECRGHMRRLKSGRMVYVRACVRHRKDLNKMLIEGDKGALTLKVRSPKEVSESGNNLLDIK